MHMLYQRIPTFRLCSLCIIKIKVIIERIFRQVQCNIVRTVLICPFIAENSSAGLSHPFRLMGWFVAYRDADHARIAMYIPNPVGQCSDGSLSSASIQSEAAISVQKMKNIDGVVRVFEGFLDARSGSLIIRVVNISVNGTRCGE